VRKAVRRASSEWPRPAVRIGWALAHHELHTRPGFIRSLRCLKRRARAFGQPFGLHDLAGFIGWALAHHELHTRPGIACSLRCLKRRARAFGPSFGRPDLPFFAWPKKGRPKKGRPPRIPALRVRESRPVFVDSASLHCHEHRRPPCRRPCGLIGRASPLPRGPVKSAGSSPQKPQRASA